MIHFVSRKNTKECQNYLQPMELFCSLVRIKALCIRQEFL